MKIRLSNRTKGILCVLLDSLGFALMDLFIRLTGPDIPFFEKAFFRNLIAAFFAFAALKIHHQPFLPREKRNIRLLLGRALFGSIGIFCNFYAVGYLLLGNASMLNKTSPFFAMIFSLIFLKEIPDKKQYLFLLMAFSGMLLIVKPGVLSIQDFLPSLIALIGGIGAGAAYTCVRELGRRGENGMLIVFVFSVLSTIFCMIPSLFFFVMPTLQELLFMVLTGVAAMVGQIFVTKAYFYAQAKEISVYDYSQVIYSTIIGFILFSEIPDAYCFLGYILIIGAGVLMYRFGQEKNEDHE